MRRYRRCLHEDQQCVCGRHPSHDLTTSWWPPEPSDQNPPSPVPRHRSRPATTSPHRPIAFPGRKHRRMSLPDSSTGRRNALREPEISRDLCVCCVRGKGYVFHGLPDDDESPTGTGWTVFKGPISQERDDNGVGRRRRRRSRKKPQTETVLSLLCSPPCLTGTACRGISWPP